MKTVSIRLNDFEEEETCERMFELDNFYGIDEPLNLSWKGYFYKCTIITNIFMKMYYKNLSDHDREIIDMVLKIKPH